MRDPEGYIRIEHDTVVRHLYAPAGPSHFLHSDLAAQWAASGDLISWKWLDDQTLESPKLPFVTLPSEWTADQFHAAARLTLRLQTEACQHGWDMKDASTWNIVFDGLRPVFVDLLSFEPLAAKPWHAAGQFNRQFLLPLLLSDRGLMEPRHCLHLWRDGVSPEITRRLIGPARFLSRYWPLMAHGSRHGRMGRESSASSASEIRRFRARLNHGLAWMLAGVHPARKAPRHDTVWGEYEHERDHYDRAEIDFKKETIAAWLQLAKPQWVLDLGCNAGEFSGLAAAAGACVICWDGDMRALEKLYRRHCTTNDAQRYHPVLAPIDDLPGGRGWEGREFPSLVQRLDQRVDLAMFLAVTHHLAIANSIRLEDIFQFAARITRKALFVELLTETDPRVQQLCDQYKRDPLDFTVARQLEAAERTGFLLIQRAKRNQDDTREYAWLECGHTRSISRAQSKA